MTADWLIFQSFQQSQQVLKAINNVSVYIKLMLGNNKDEERSREIEQSIRVVESLVDQLDLVLRQADSRADREESGPILGVDPRRQQFFRDFFDARRRGRFSSSLFTGPISDVKALLRSNSKVDQRALVECLNELRVLVEESMHGDIVQILGAI